MNQKSESEAESEARRNRSQKDQKSSSFSSNSASASVASDPVRTGCKGNQCGNMSDNEENSAEVSTMKVKALKAEKRKLKAAIARQLNELAGRVAGVSSGVEPRGLEEMESIKATLERLETIKEKISKYWKNYGHCISNRRTLKGKLKFETKRTS